MTAPATPTAVWLPAKPGLEPAAAWELASEQIDALADIERSLPKPPAANDVPAGAAR